MEAVEVNFEMMYGNWKDAWRKPKILLICKTEEGRVYQHKEKKLQSEFLEIKRGHVISS